METTTILKVKKLIEAGISQRAISTKLNLSTSAVWRLVKKHGFKQTF